MLATKSTDKERLIRFQGSDESTMTDWTFGDSNATVIINANVQPAICQDLSPNIGNNEKFKFPELIVNQDLTISVESFSTYDESIVAESSQSIEINNLDKRQVFEDLRSLKEEASEKGWDGYDASPLNVDSYNQARKFIEFLPEHIETPDLSVDPDGDVSFNWIKDSNNIFTINISPDGIISYAGLFEGNTSYGKEKFIDEIPEPIIKNIKRLFP